MNLLRGNCSRPRGSTDGDSGATPTVALATSLIMVCLVVFIVFSISACGAPTPTEPTPTQPTPHQRTPTLTLTPSPDVPTIVTPTLVSPVTLTGPESGSEFEWGSEITLHWSSLYTLQVGECYRLKMQAEGQNALAFYSTEDNFTLSAPSSGKYKWAVAIVRSIGEDRYELVSHESDWHSFEIVLPKPVVRSISPESVVQGRSVQVVVSGENLTHSLIIVIGVSLQTTFVDSTTITATVPMTLVAAKYPVVLQDATGATISSAPSMVSFTVETQSVTRTPVPPRYRPPVLGWGGIIACNVTFGWEWAGTLAEDEWFAVRAWREGIDRHESLTWTKECEYTHSLRDGGEYTWEVAICRGDPSAAHCGADNELAVSERHLFVFRGGCDGPGPKPTPPDKPAP